jgi:hypothetical protein
MSGHADDDHDRERADAEDSDLDRCRRIVRPRGGASRRCARTPRRAPDGRRGEFCASHAPPEPGRGKKARGPARADDDATPTPRGADARVLLRRPTTQDEIADAVFRLAEGIESGAIRPAQGRLILDVLERLSAHIERESADAETVVGGGVLRAIAGAAIQQAGSPTLRTASLEDLDRIAAGVEEDRKRGIAPPADWAGLDRRYLSPPHAAASKADDAPGDGEDAA